MRASGVLLPISSLPSPYGIGTMGKEARDFVDFLVGAGQTYWQILPICPTSYGDSPYQSFSSFAGNPYFIDLELLCQDGLLTKEECQSMEWGEDPGSVDYARIYQARYEILRLIQDRFFENEPEDFENFCIAEAGWLSEYAMFMTLKDKNGKKAWNQWPKELKIRQKEAMEDAWLTYGKEIDFYRMIQYLFFKQWRELKEYANDKGIKIIGDVPIYVAADSADVWANPKQFYLNERLEPVEVAGCPPDAFTDDGQFWGNPLFRWDVMKKDGFSWWTKRISAMSDLYDIVRIDHFRGFDSYYAIPAKDKNARNGKWRQGPGMDLFKTLERKLGKLPIIAEDLGFLTPSVGKLLKASGFPGMKVLEFAFDTREESDYLPHNYDHHCVVYTGTHDNETLTGWLENAPKEVVDHAVQYLRLSEEEGYHWGMIRGAMASVADLAVIPVQDLLGLGNEARMNTPSTLGENWKWRLLPGQLTKAVGDRLLEYTKLYCRVREEKTVGKKPKKPGKAGKTKKKSRPTANNKVEK